jgi:diacylglycerol kinase family enzyme
MRHIFVINPKPFIRRSFLDKVIFRIETQFKVLNEEYEVYVSRYPRDAVGFIRKRLIRQNTEEKFRVYAVGGSGTLYDCLNGTAGSAVELTQMPYGSTNDFLRSFDFNTILKFLDIEQLCYGSLVNVDMFSCNANYAINYCAVGMEALTVLNAARLYGALGRHFSKFTRLCNYCYSLCRAAAMLRHELNDRRYNLTIDEVDYSGVYSSIIVANGSFYGCAKNAPEGTQPWDGYLNIIIKNKNGSREVRGKKININSQKPLIAALDGEVFNECALEIKIIPSSVRFVVPKSPEHGLL